MRAEGGCLEPSPGSSDLRVELRRRGWRRSQKLFADEREVSWRKRKAAKLDDSIQFALADYDPRVLVGISVCVFVGYGMFGLARFRYFSSGWEHGTLLVKLPPHG